MDAVPEEEPVTTPVDPIVATVVLLLLQVPVPSLSDIVDPAHTAVIPLMAAGSGFTVTVAVVKHPAPIE
jgi:hypothetical protein